jgi:aromatic-amino-acid transaminase
MFETLTSPAPDKIIELIGIYAADPREGKLDLGIGVYKDARGRTPVMRAVKAAEERLWREQETKAYLGVLGEPTFVAAMRDLALGDAVPAERVGGAQTPGGTGAVRQLCELIRRARPGASVWYSDPTWPNHPAIAAYLKMPAQSYRYYDAATGAVDFAAMQADLAAAAPGDVVILHGCCHNPTGTNLDAAEWAALTEDFGARGITPMIDLAYQGFGDGLEADAAGLRRMVAALPETMLAVSCSKNFGLYRDRAGAALVVARDPERAAVTQGNLGALNRLRAKASSWAASSSSIGDMNTRPDGIHQLSSSSKWT